jgi:hypothetical protein
MNAQARDLVFIKSSLDDISFHSTENKHMVLQIFAYERMEKKNFKKLN